MLKKFLKEEKAQGAIEYILLAGGIIVAAVVIFAVYTRMARTTGEEIERQANATVFCAKYTSNTSCPTTTCRWDVNLTACLAR